MLHALSEKARSGTEFVARLKTMQDRIEVGCRKFCVINKRSLLWVN